MLTFPSLAKLIVLYFGIPCFITGIIGGFFNLMIFFNLHTFRQNSCAFYLTIMNVFNMAQMLTGLLPRIMITGLNIDWTETSIFYCHFQAFSIQLTALMSSTCLCLATMDQYFATCPRPRWQRWCHIKFAYRLVGICMIFWCLEQIPTLIYYHHHYPSSLSNNVTCRISNELFAKFNFYINRAFLWYMLPIFITALFGILAYCNIHQLVDRTVPLVRRELDKQLAVMVFIQVIWNLMVIIPSLIFGILIQHVNPSQDPIVVVDMKSAHAMNSCVFYLYFASPFYIYMCVSKRFRRQFLYVICRIDLNQWSY